MSGLIRGGEVVKGDYIKRLYAATAGLFIASARRAGKLSVIHKLCILSVVVIAFSLTFCENIMEQVKNYNEIMEIISVSPADNAVNVAIDTSISASFTNDPDISTVNSSTFYVNGGAVTGAFSYNPAIKAVIFTPASDLLHNTLYTVNVTQGLRNLVGNYITAPYTWSFTTLQYYFNVISVYPLNGGTDVPVNTDVIVQFDDNINPATLTAATFTVSGGVTTSGITYDAVTRTAAFNQAANLSNSTTYTVTLTTGIKNTRGESMAADYSWSFTTAAAAVPEIYVISPIAEIFSGDTYDFGSVLNPATVSAGFTVGNSGTAVLNILNIPVGVTITGPDAAEFTTSLVSPQVIGAGGNMGFIITFKPSAVASDTVKNAVLTIPNDDSDEGAFIINLTGVALASAAPEIQVVSGGVILVTPTSTLDFGTLQIGFPGTIAVSMQNIGAGNLDVTGWSIGGSDPAYFDTDFGAIPVTIPPGGTKNFNITFRALVKTNAKATITFQNNDSSEGSFVIKLKGRTMP